MKSGNLNFLEPSEPLQACNGTALPLHGMGFRSLLGSQNPNFRGNVLLIFQCFTVHFSDLLPDVDLLRSKHVGVFLNIFMYFNIEINILD